MRFSAAIFVATAFAGIANAVEFTNLVFNNVTAGEPFTFTWANAAGPVSIELLNGNPNDLQTVSTITSGQSGRSFTWNVPANLPSDTYAFRIRDSNSENYSVQTQLIGGSDSSSSPSTTGSATSTTSSGTSTTASSTTSSSVSSTPGLNSTTSRTSSSPSMLSHTRTRTSASPTASGTSAPNSGNMASGLTSNFAFLFVAAGALMFL